MWYSDPVPEDGPPGGNEKTPALLNLAKYHYKGRMELPQVENEILNVGNSATQYYMCGPPGFMETQKESLVSLGVDESRIHSEGF